MVAAADHGDPPLVVERFSRRAGHDDDLGRRLLRALVTASHGERGVLQRRRNPADRRLYAVYSPTPATPCSRR